jgi:hypothetical protein
VRGWLLAAGAVVVAAGAGIAGVSALGREKPAQDQDGDSATEPVTVEVVRRDLARV